MQKPLLEVKSIVKEFSGVRVLDQVGFSLKPGEILGLIGENGAGKSTLMKILSGIYHPTEGEVLLNGEPLILKDPLAAKRSGIAMIPQEFNLVETLKVFENVFLGNEKRGGLLLDKKGMRERTGEILKTLQTDLSPDAPVSRLSVAQKQMVEIAKALVHDSRLLILDEPTTVLTGQEIELLFSLMGQLRERGVSMIFISHKLGEVRTICDKTLILRDGQQIALEDTKKLDEPAMARMMVGRELNQIFPDRTPCGENTVLEVEGLEVPRILEDISFSLREGEILGIAGLMGAGRTELAEAVMGLRHRSGGTIRLEGRELTGRSPREAVDAGLAYLSEDRQGKGIVMNFSIPENTTLISLKKYIRLFIDKAREQETADAYTEKFRIRAASLKSKLRFLSGGNQQKVYLAKWMDTGPRVLILDEPTRGIDVNAKMEIYQFVHDLAARGTPCIVISSELEEVLGLCHRVLVMKGGRIQGELKENEMNEEEIMLYATGIKGGTES